MHLLKMTVFGDFFAGLSCVENVEDAELEQVLSSNTGCHSKVTSLIHNDQFRVEATEYVRKNGYQKGIPNITLADFCKWVDDTQHIKICEKSASN